MSEARPLRAGDTVQLRSADEILATLDDDAMQGGLPFMPEMLRFAGHGFTVTAQAVKVCDTTGGPDNLRLDDTVILDDLRCDGSAHGGCQAGCRLFWRASWLRPVDGEPQTGFAAEDQGRSELETRTDRATLVPREVDGRAFDTYRCQATNLVAASRPITRKDKLDNYVDELRSGNVQLRRFLRVLARAASRKIARRFLHEARFPLRSQTPPARGIPLQLQPGELVRVKTRDEILQAVDATGKNRGLTFDWEMLPHCGKSYRVRERVEQIVNERTGEMTHISSDCIILDGAMCSGDWSQGRWFCPRGVFPYWREAWLERVDEGPAEPKYDAGPSITPSVGSGH